MHADDPLDATLHLAPAQLSALGRLGIRTVRDLLYHFPTRYEAPGTEASARTLVPGAKVTLFGTLSGLKARKLWKSKRNITEGWFEDGSGRVKVLWFNQPYMASYVQAGALVRLAGAVGGSAEKPYIANPEVERIAASDVPVGIFKAEKPGDAPLAQAASIFPVYPETRGITSRWVYHALKKIFEAGVHRSMEDPVPSDARGRLNLPDIATALVWIHAPEQLPHAEAARKRFSFEEMFALQVARAQERAENDAARSFEIANAQTQIERFLDTSAFPPTRAQRRALHEIASDIDPSGSAARPMARLLEGDVGSGKTLVAAASAYAVVNARPPGRASGTLQVAYMAPTEILAQQHFESFIQYFKHLPISVALLTGSGCKKFPSKVAPDKPTDVSRAQLLKWVASGEIAMVVGTHALIQKSLKFQHLALAIVDEQHRFGTRQRAQLARKGGGAATISDEDIVRSRPRAAGPAERNSGRPDARNPLPHFLSMTATPIPRTLALTVYGDLDISVLDELPPGRAKITTKIIGPDERQACYEEMRQQITRGRQSYVICPRINEPDPAKIGALLAKSARAEAARLKKEVFPEFEIGLLHGAMRSKEKDEVMARFSAGKVQILVATSVVEVGVNVPNATVILIEGAERFGLAQLHQLRGRVMRSSHPPLCFLLPGTKSDASMKRLRALERSADGFALAEADLATRGPGDLFGHSQWGVSDLGMEALKNPRLIGVAREEARTIVAADPLLSEHSALAERVARGARELHAE